MIVTWKSNNFMPCCLEMKNKPVQFQLHWIRCNLVTLHTIISSDKKITALRLRKFHRWRWLHEKTTRPVRFQVHIVKKLAFLFGQKLGLASCNFGIWSWDKKTQIFLLLHVRYLSNRMQSENKFLIGKYLRSARPWKNIIWKRYFAR